MRPGGGGRFAALESKIAARGDVRNPAAVAAAIGRKKYGASQMAKWSAAGRRRGDPAMPMMMGGDMGDMVSQVQSTSRGTRKSNMRMRKKKGPPTTTAFMGGDKFRSY